MPDVEPRNEELEKAIVDDPTNRSALAVLADWLEERGSPRGQLINLELKGKHAEAKAFFDQHLGAFLGSLAQHREVYDEGWNNSRSHLRTPQEEEAWQANHKQAFLWENGFIRRVRLSHDVYSVEDFDGDLAEILSSVLDHPSARFVSEFTFQSNGDPSEDNLQSLIDVLAKKAPLTTRKITFGDNVDQISWHHTGNLAALWKRVPKLKTFEIESGEFEVGELDAPSLERAVFITGGLTQSCGRDILAGKLPNLRHLEVYFGDENYGASCAADDVVPFLARTDLPRLEYLGLKNAAFQDDLVRLLAGARLLASVKTLDLSKGVLTDDGARMLLGLKRELANVECLDLRENFLSLEVAKTLAGLCPRVLTDNQKTSDYRYVSIAE
jgi:uncharacterized protein (TIGR02996 family)